MDPSTIRPIRGELANQLILEAMAHLGPWALRSVESFRNAVLGIGSFAVNPMLSLTDAEGVDYLQYMLIDTIREGRMIDFGFIPNDVLKVESVRSRDLFEAGAFTHPFPEWLGVARWEGGFNAYFISPNPAPPHDIMVVEFYAVAVPGAPTGHGMIVILHDIVSIVTRPGLTSVAVYPAIYGDESEDEKVMRGANSLDPLVVMLRLLHDASVPVARFEPPARLNRARAKVGRFALPPHVVLDTTGYVSAFRKGGWTTPKRAGQGGHHASPAAHWRRAHPRRLASGKVVPVQASKVNWRDDETMKRLFYSLKH
jgi:hypothetical protein